MIELGTVDIHNSSTGRWSFQWLNFRKTWWVEEDKFKTFGEILVVKGQRDFHLSEWRIHTIGWTHASSLSGRDDLSWFLSKRTENTESIIRIVNIVRPVEWLEVVAFKDDLRTTTDGSEIWK
jgi:hypothetical protein